VVASSRNIVYGCMPVHLGTAGELARAKAWVGLVGFVFPAIAISSGFSPSHRIVCEVAGRPLQAGKAACI